MESQSGKNLLWVYGVVLSILPRRGAIYLSCITYFQIPISLGSFHIDEYVVRALPNWWLCFLPQQPSYLGLASLCHLTKGMVSSTLLPFHSQLKNFLLIFSRIPRGTHDKEYQHIGVAFKTNLIVGNPASFWWSPGTPSWNIFFNISINPYLIMEVIFIGFDIEPKILHTRSYFNLFKG